MMNKKPLNWKRNSISTILENMAMTLPTKYAAGKRRSVKNGGFTLIEMSLVILVLGCVIALVSTGYQSYQSKKRIEITQQRVTDAAKKIYDYRKINGHYPCPSSLTAIRDTSVYGVPIPNCTGGTGGTCTGGTCTQTSPRGPAFGNVEIGALPFRELGIAEADAYDSYGSRITYAVTQSMTDKDTIKEDAGGISIQNENNQDVFSPVGSGAFIVFSTGKNRMGAHGLEGGIATPCAGNQFDTDNCDFETGTAPAMFRAVNHSENTAGTNYFDDTVAFNVPEERAMWRKGLVEKSEKNDDIIDMAENKIIMSAQSAIASADAQLSILFDSSNANYDGSLHIRPDAAVPGSGRLITKTTCDVNNSGCFSISTLLPNCPPGEYVTGLYDGKFHCGKVFFGCKLADGLPDTSQYIKGINPDGTPKCAPVPVQPVDGVCGSADGHSDLLAAPTSNFDLCNPGVPTSVSGDGSPATPYTWTCQPPSAGGSPSPTCSAKHIPPPYDGVCGDDNGLILATPPTSLCHVGNVSSFTTGPAGWNWTCLGEGNPHTNAQCGSTLLVTPSCQAGP